MKRKRLGDMLIEAGLITEEQLATAIREKSSTQKLGDALLQRGYITERQLIEVLEVQLGIPHVSLYQYPFDPGLFHLVPKDFALKHLMIPMKKEGDRLYVAAADPTDFFAIEHLRLSTGFHIETAIATKDDILTAIRKYYDPNKELEDMHAEFVPTDRNEAETSDERDAPIVRLVNRILQSAISQRASDIHIDPQETRIVIRNRIDGILRVDRELPKHMQGMLTARLKVMGNLDITEHRAPQDGRLKTTIEFRPVDIRISTIPTIHGEKIVLRILDLSNTLMDLARLGFNDVNLQRFESLIERPSGMVLITGPTGSGKTSTLYAALNRLNREEVNIVTIEDPVEFQLEGINQIQVNPNIGLTFAKGLRSILRQDPNIIMVGEIRDRETAEVAVRASLTGHLVLSTIHTGDSISTITRLLDMEVEPFLVTASLSGIVAQRLVRRVCRDCMQTMLPNEREKEIFQRKGIGIERICRGRGCPACNMTGYRGRIAIHEVLTITDDMRQLILKRDSMSALRDLAIRQGTIFLLDDGLMKVKQGMTTTEEVLRVTLSE